MPKKQPLSVIADERITLRVGGDTNQRAAALVPAMAKDFAAQGLTRVSRAVVLKRALAMGLEQLEKQYSRK
jgi:hypothetical protein